MEDILKLDASSESVVKINRFLNKTNIDSKEHVDALCHLVNLYNQTKQIDYIIQLSDEFLSRYNKENSIILLDKIIEVTVEDYKEYCLNAIKRKRALLESYEENIYYFDMILFNRYNLDEKIKFIKLFLGDDTSKQNRLQAKYLLATAYFENRQFSKFYNDLDTTKELALELGEYNIYESLIYYEAHTNFLQDDLSSALKIINENPIKSESFNHKTNLLLLKIKFRTKDYRRCSILETEFEEDMESADFFIRKEFYELCINLYTILSNKISIDAYKLKLKKLTENKHTIQLDYIKEEQLKTIKIKKEKIVNTIEKPVFKTIKKVVPTLNELNDFYYDSSLIYKSFYLEDQFREQLRLSLVELNKQINFTDCYIVTKNFESFHFKVERLYIKKEVNLEIIERFSVDNSEIISFNTKQDNLYCPFEQEILKENFCTIFPLFNNECFGAIYFIAAEETLISGKLSFEKLHGFVKFYNAISLIHYHKEEVLSLAKTKLEILDSNSFFYAYTDLDYFYPNDHLKQLFNIKNKITLSSFFSTIDLAYYNEFVEQFNNMDTYFESLVNFNNNKTVLVKVTKINDYKKIFIFEDYTKVEETKQNLINVAYNNPITNLKNNQFLNIEIHKYFDMKKFSAVLVNFKDLQKYSYLYSEKFSFDILRYLGKVLPKFNEEYDYYHLNFDKLIILIKDVNDKRALKQIITKLDEYLVEELSSINTRLIPRFTYGTYRSLVDTKEKSLNKMLEILSDSLLNADDFYDSNIGFYDIDLYKNRFLREQLITYISEAIDQKNVNILFSQCVNMKDSVIEFYEAKLNINKYKVESELLEEVIKRRNLTTRLEQYLIQRTFHEMNLIYEKTNFSINVVLNIDEYSFIKTSFVNYLEAQINQFKIDKRRVIFKINKVYSEAVENITYLLKEGYQVALSNIEDLSLIKPNYFIFNQFNQLNQFNDEYVKGLCNILTKLDVKFILANTSKNEQIEHYKEIVNLFMGNVYKQQLTYLDITNIFKQSLGI